MLRLSSEQLATALSGLSPIERLQLLQLLQQREEMAAEAPEDTRPPIGELIEQARQKAAVASDNPERWLEMDATHWECHERHYQRLIGERRSDMQDIDAWMAASLAAWNEAEELAAVECLHPDTVRSDAQPDEIVNALASLPPATRRDIEYSKARREDARIAHLLAKAGIHE